MNEFYAEFCRLFSRAEASLKEAESVCGELCFPAVNELRYAGCHVSRALSSENRADSEDALRSAEKHCRRSIFDSIEIQIAYFLDGIRLFHSDYRKVVISEVVQDYLSYLRDVRAAQDFLAKNSIHDSDDNIRVARNHLEKIRDIFDRLESARAELNKRLRRERWSFYISCFTLLVAILTLLATLLGLIQPFK